MANGSYEIDEDTFKKMPVEDQNWITYKTFNKYRDDIECRIRDLEKGKLKDKGFAGAMGLIGGFIAGLTK